MTLDGTTVVGTGAASPITIPTTGTLAFGSHTVTVHGTNTVGNSAESAPFTIGLVGPGAVNPHANPAITPGVTTATIEWSAPTPAPDSYDVSIDGGAAANQTTLSKTFTGLSVGSHTVTIVTKYGATSGASVPFTFSILSNSILYQDITVTRQQITAPILTQRCGVWHAPSWDLTSFLGTPAAYVGTTLASADQGNSDTGGTAPTLTAGGTPISGTEFATYPLPLPTTYETHCPIALGTANLITQGTYAGQFFQADGQLNELTVADYRDSDLGWNVTATMSDFTNGASGDFSGNYLGWKPAPVADVTTGGSNPYTKQVVAGGTILPIVGAGTGLASASTLATGKAAHGLGITHLDARLKLLIPASEDNGTYTGTLTFTLTAHE